MRTERLTVTVCECQVAHIFDDDDDDEEEEEDDNNGNDLMI